MLAQGFHERQIRRHTFYVVGPAHQNVPALRARPRGDFGQQSRLADAGVPADEDHASLAELRRGHAFHERAELALAAHERCERWPKQRRSLRTARTSSRLGGHGYRVTKITGLTALCAR